MILKRQNHIEERRLRPGARRVHQLDDALERHIRMREGLEIHPTRDLQDVGCRHVLRHRGSQNERIDEHPHDVVEGCLASPRDRSTDHDVLVAGQLGQDYRKGGVQGHEQRRIVFARSLVQRLDHSAVHRELVSSAQSGRRCRSWAVGGDARLRPDLGQRALPERFLSGHDRGRVAALAEHIALPENEVGVLDVEGRPARFLPHRTRRVGRHQIPSQRAQGETVDRDVVDDQYEYVFVRRPRQDADQHGN